MQAPASLSKSQNFDKVVCPRFQIDRDSQAAIDSAILYWYCLPGGTGVKTPYC